MAIFLLIVCHNTRYRMVAEQFQHSGWEGTANDSRVSFDTIARPDVNFLTTADGYYHVVESGYTNMLGFLAPYSRE